MNLTSELSTRLHPRTFVSMSQVDLVPFQRYLDGQGFSFALGESSVGKQVWVGVIGVFGSRKSLSHVLLYVFMSDRISPECHLVLEGSQYQLSTISARGHLRSFWLSLFPFVDNNSKSHLNERNGGYIHAILLIFCILRYQTIVKHENYTSKSLTSRKYSSQIHQAHSIWCRRLRYHQFGHCHGRLLRLVEARCAFPKSRWWSNDKTMCVCVSWYFHKFE